MRSVAVRASVRASRFVAPAARVVAARRNLSLVAAPAVNVNSRAWVLGAAAAIAVAAWTVKEATAEEKKADAKVDYDAVRKDIQAILDNPKYDDGSYAPVLIRLAWHASGTYSKADHTGGSNGATMRYQPEAGWGANAGLATARDLLEKVKAKHPGISYADLWTLAGVVAVKSMGGPDVAWRPGRSDKPDGSTTVPDGRLPDASKKQDHIRDIFYRMGFNDQEIVALAGAHAVGRCHRDRSGFDGPWTNSPTAFSNDYFVQLLERTWTERKWDGPRQFEDESKKLMMLPADIAFRDDPEFRKYVEKYAKDEALFFKDFSAAFSKLLELGVKFPDAGAKAAAAPAKATEGEKKPWYKFW